MSHSKECTNITEWPFTDELLQAVLREHHKNLTSLDNVSFPEFTIRCGSEGESVLSEIWAVTVSYSFEDDSSGELLKQKFIAKILPRDPFTRYFVTETQFDLREIKFYTQIVPDLEKFQTRYTDEGSSRTLPLPKCYYGHYSPKRPESVLALENIKLRNFSNVEFSSGLNLKQATAALESIAQIHALSLTFKIKEDKDLFEHYPFLFQTSKVSDSYQRLLERGLPELSQFLERQPGLENVLERLNAIKPNTKEIIESLLSPEEPMALITHTDFWCNNLMFKEEDDVCECIILDWQMVTFSRPTNDLALLLVSSTPSELRRTQTEFLLDKYWEALTSNCKKLGLDVENELKFDRGQLGQNYKSSQLLAILMCIGSVDIALGNPQTEERLLELLKDLYAEGIFNEDMINKSLPS